MNEATDIVAQKWSALEPQMERVFFGFPPLRPYLIQSAFGQELAQKHKDNRFWAEDILVGNNLQGRKIESIMSLCCGFGVVEQRILSQLPSVRYCLGIDLAEGAIAVARERATTAGLGDRVEYRSADLNTFDWPTNEYDLIIANGALHHLINLESVLLGIKGALKEGGTLYANEHVGASLQDYPVRQLELINAAAYLVPPELRGRTGTTFRHSHRYLRDLHRLFSVITGSTYVPDPAEHPEWSGAKKLITSVLRKIASKTTRSGKRKFHFGIMHDSQKKHLLRTDPSEGIRAAEIIPLVKRYFREEVEVRSYGGGILAYCLDSKFYDTYDDENATHRKILDILCQLESALMEMGELDIEHAIIIGHK
jgi:ubiquinone/menaquinone biosynthesis C-methylase UbiE